MNDNVFLRSPIQSALAKERAAMAERAATRATSGATALPGPVAPGLPGSAGAAEPAAPDPRAAIEAAARQYGAPANLIMALGEAAGLAPEDAPRAAEGIATALSGPLGKGAKHSAALRELFPDAPEGFEQAVVARSNALYDEIYAPKPPAPAEEPGGSVVGDAVAQLGGSINRSLGSGVRGLGEAIATVGDYTTTPLAEAITGEDYGPTQNVLAPIADAIQTFAKKTGSDLVSKETKEAIAASTPNGDIFRPSTWTLGDAPSLRGYTMLALDVFGSLVPVVAAGAFGGTGAAAAVGGATGGGAGAETASQIIDEMAQERLPDGRTRLETESAYYRELVASGLSEANALRRTKAAAERMAFLMTAPISAAGGALTSKLLNPASKIVEAGSRLARAGGRAALSGLEEGSQEVAETMASRAGTNVGAGTDAPIADGTFGDFILGAMAGGVPGGAAGAMSGPAEEGPEPEPEPEPLGLPAPTSGGTVIPEPPAPGQSPDALGAAQVGEAGGGGVAQPVASPVAPAGPVEAALRAGPRPVAPDMRPGDKIVIAPEGISPIDGTFVSESPAGVRVRSSDGEDFEITREEIESGATALRPQEPAPAAPAPFGLAEIAARLAQRKPPAAEAPAPITDIDAAKQRLAYIEGQAKGSGWNSRLSAERAKAQAAIAQLGGEPAPAAQAAPPAEPQKSATAAAPAPIRARNGQPFATIGQARQAVKKRGLDPDAFTYPREGKGLVAVPIEAAGAESDPVTSGAPQDAVNAPAADLTATQDMVAPEVIPSPAAHEVSAPELAADTTDAVKAAKAAVAKRAAKLYAESTPGKGVAVGSTGERAAQEATDPDDTPPAGGKPEIKQIREKAGKLSGVDQATADRISAELGVKLSPDSTGGYTFSWKHEAKLRAAIAGSAPGEAQAEAVAEGSAEQTTPGTRVKWSTLAEWMDAAREIEHRKTSAARHTAGGEHMKALKAVGLDLIARADRETLERFRNMLVTPNNYWGPPPRGYRRGTTWETMHQRVTDLLAPKPAKPAEAREKALKGHKPAPAAIVTQLNDDFGNWYVPGGSVLKSATGRELSPAPTFTTEDNRRTKLSIGRQREWLVKEVRAEAEARGDRRMMRHFEGLNPRNFSRSDADEVHEYLFGDAWPAGDPVSTPAEIATMDAAIPERLTADGFHIGQDGKSAYRKLRKDGVTRLYVAKPRPGDASVRLFRMNSTDADGGMPNTEFGEAASYDDAVRIMRENGAFSGAWTVEPPVVTSTPAEIKAEAKAVERDPTDGQKEAGNYAMGHIKVHGLDVTIETPKGATRRGKAPDGTEWSVKMPADYGYIRRTEGADGDHVDVYVGENVDHPRAFIVDQFDPKTDHFDEHKIVLGAITEAQATAIYDAGFSDGSGPRRRKAVSEYSIDGFKLWLRNGDQSKPAAWRSLDRDAAISKSIIGAERQKADLPPPPVKLPEGYFQTYAKPMTASEAKGTDHPPRTIKAIITRQSPFSAIDGYGATVNEALEAAAAKARRQSERELAAKPEAEGGSDLDAMFGDVLAEVRAEEAPAEPEKAAWSGAESPEAEWDSASAANRALIFHNQGWNIAGTEKLNEAAKRNLDRDWSDLTPTAKAKVAENWQQERDMMNKTGDFAPGALDAAIAKADAERAAAAPRKAPAPTAGAAAASAVKNVAMGLDEATKGLLTLFNGKGNKLSSGLTFDRETYEQAKPMFIAAARNFAAAGSDIRAVMKAVIQHLVGAGLNDDGLRQMRPYVVEFTREVQAGAVSLGENAPAPAAPPAEPQESEETDAESGRDGGDDDAPLDDVSPENGEELAGGGDREAGPGGGDADGSGDGDAGADRSPAGSGLVGHEDAVLPDGAAGPHGGGRALAAGPVGRDEELPHRLTGGSPGNFRIDAEALGKGTESEKVAANLAAIRLALALDREGRFATPEEQAVLARYVGWGGLKSIFDIKKKDGKDFWGRAYRDLKELLTRDEYEAAFDSVRNAHYTSPGVVQAMWRAMRHFGFTGGRALEPTVGAGNFLGLQPEDMAAGTEWHAAELDFITGKIARHLYPEANIFAGTGFEDAPFADGAFDVAIGNPPFGSNTITDKTRVRAHLSGMKVHNYIIAKAGMHLRPGGVMAMVVTHRFLDTANPEARDVLAKQFRFIGAIRLPNDAFKANAGTEVTTDIVFLQKLRADEKPDLSAAWLDTDGEIATKDGPARVNRYFAEHAEHILGASTLDGTMYGGRGGKYAVRSDGRDLGAAIDRIVTEDWAALAGALHSEKDADVAAVRAELTTSDLPVGGMALIDGKIRRRDLDDDAGNAVVEEITPETYWREHAAQWQEVADAAKALKASAGVPTAAEIDAWNEASAVAFATNGERKAKPTRADQAVYDIADAVARPATFEWAHDDGLAAIEAALERKRLGRDGYDALRALLDLRNRTLALLAAERADDPNMAALRAALNASYDAFVAAHGFVSDPANVGLLGGDVGPELGLEANYKPAVKGDEAKRLGIAPSKAEALKADILSTRVFFPVKEITSAADAQDGVRISLSERGRVDLGYVAKLTGRPVQDVIAELTSGDAPTIFFDPESDRYEHADAYLSGNVRYKLDEARKAGLAANVRALEAAQPAPKAKEQIEPTIRSQWVPPDIFEGFLTDLGVQEPSILLLPSIGKMSAEGAGFAATPFGQQFIHQSDRPAASILNQFNALAAGKTLTIYDKDDDKLVVNKQITEEVGAIMERMASTFKDWVYADPDRTRAVVDAFNQKMNTHRRRSYNGVDFLRLVGANPSINLRRTQKNAAWRMILEPTVLLDHVVGAGKTYTIAAGLMERKRLGLSRKPLVVVPNHLVVQWAREWYHLYPGAKLLAATPDDFAKKNRRRLLARIATGNYDAVIIGHTSLGFIETPGDDVALVINEKMDELKQALEDARDAGESKRTLTQIRNKIEAYGERLQGLLERSVDEIGVTLADMGVDYLAVDEAHEFKNLEYGTGGERVVGMNDPNGSKKAFDLYVKIRGLRERGGAVSFATGTPVSNSLVELYTVMNYLANDELKKRGLSHFDAWSAAYAQTQTRLEYTATQKIKARRVLSGLVNLSSLVQLYHHFADTISMDDIKRIYAEDVAERNAKTGGKERTQFPVPRVRDGGRVLDSADVSERQSEFMDYLVARMDAIQDNAGDRDYPKIDNPLWVLSDARKMSLDIRAVDPSARRDPGGKVARAADKIKRTYDRWNADLGAQLVFCDLSTPAKTSVKEARKMVRAAAEIAFGNRARQWVKAHEGSAYAHQWALIRDRVEAAAESGDLDTDAAAKFNAMEAEADGVMLTADTGFSVYDDLRDALIEKGIPEREIAFIHDYNTPDQKAKLFARVNAGQVRVLMGSSQKMGAGTNAQKRLVALHHMDAPWRPSDVEQREGRIIRQGNSLYERDPDGFEVEINAYSTSGTSDTVMWQILQRKAAPIEQFREGGLDAMEEDGADSDQYAEFMATSTGNPVFRLKLEAERELTRLRSEVGGLILAQNSAQAFLRDYDVRMGRAKATIAALGSSKAGDIALNGKKASAAELAGTLAEVAADYERRYAAYTEAYSKAFEAQQQALAAGEPGDKLPSLPKAPARPTIISQAVTKKSPYAALIVDALADVDAGKAVEAKIGDVNVRITRAPSPFKDGEFVFRSEILVGGEWFRITTGYGLSAGLNNSLQRMLTPDGVQSEVDYLVRDAKRTAERLEERRPREEQAAATHVDQSAIRETQDLVDWFAAKVALAESEADRKRAGKFNRYIEGDTKRPLRGSKTAIADTAVRTFTHEGHVYEGTGLAAGGGSRTFYEATRKHDGWRAVVLAQPKEGAPGEVEAVRVLLEPESTMEDVDERLGTAEGVRDALEKFSIAFADLDAVAKMDAGAMALWEDDGGPALARVKRPGRAFKDTAALRKHLASAPRMVERLIGEGRIVLHETIATLPGGPHGRAVQGMTDGKGVIHLVATMLTKDTALPVLLHEVFHSGVEPLIGSKAWGVLMARTARMLAQARERAQAGRTVGSQVFWDRALARMEHAGKPPTPEELAAYVIEESANGAPAGLREVVENLLGAVKAFILRRFGRQLGAVTPAELRSLAVAALRSGTVGAPAGPGPRGGREDLFSVSKDVLAVWQASLKSVASLATSADMPMGAVPAVLRRTMNFPPVRMVMKAGKMQKVIGDHADIGLANMKIMPALISDPIAVFAQDGKTGDALVLTRAKTADGRPIVASLLKDGATRDRRPASIVVTIYPLDRPIETIGSLIEKGALVYEAEEGSVAGISMPGAISQAGGRLSGRPTTASESKILHRVDIFKPRFSVAPQPGSFTAPGIPAATDAQIETAERGLIGNALTRAMEGDTSILGLVPGRPLFAELAKKMPAAQEYLHLKLKMDALRNEWHARMDGTAQAWRKLIGQDGAANAKLMDLMHEATLLGADPTQPYESILNEQDREALAGSRRGRAWEIAAARGLEDEGRRAEHAKLRKRLRALPAAFQAMFGTVRDEYRALNDEFEKTLLDNIDRAMAVGLRTAERAHEAEIERIRDDGLTGKERDDAIKAADKRLAATKWRHGANKRARMADLRARFETQKVPAPYFPLARFGSFFVTARDKETGQVVHFSRHERPGPGGLDAAKKRLGWDTGRSQQEVAREMRAKGYAVEIGVIGETDIRQMVDPAFVADVEAILDTANVPKAVMDAVWQRWLETLPDLSIRKSRIHRKGTPGFDSDAFRAFGHHMFHGAHQLARLRYAMLLEESLELAGTQAKGQADPVRAGLVFEEMRRRHAYVMNPKGAWWAQAATSAAFVWYLAMSPAAAIVNVTQTTILGTPILAAAYPKAGVSGAASALGKALTDFTRGRGHAMDSSRLSEDEKAAMEEAYRRGTIDKSQAHDLAGVGETGVEYSAVRTKVMGVISWMFHHTERMNREITFLAAYRMAREAGAEREAAVEQASDLTWKTHFDYANTSRPRLMQNDAARVALVFRNYSVNMLWRLVRDVHQSINAKDPAERREAIHQLAGITGSLFLHAGVRGVWGYSLAMAIIGLFFAGGGDDAEDELKKAVVGTLGTQLGGIVLNGVPGHLTQTNLTSRIGMPDLWFRSPDRQLEGDDEYHYWLSEMLGAAVGMAETGFRGVSMIRDGEVYRGVETLLPKAVKDVMRAGRYLTEGVQTMKGDPIIDAPGVAAIITQALGFTPAAVAERYETNTKMKNAEQRIMDERSEIMADYVNALRAGHPPSAGILDRLRAFNATHPTYPITGESLKDSARARAQASGRMDSGVSLNPRLGRTIRDAAAPLIYGE